MECLELMPVKLGTDQARDQNGHATALAGGLEGKERSEPCSGLQLLLGSSLRGGVGLASCTSLKVEKP
jgi:hypothetical protein